MLTAVQSLALGALQGLTEFLPISSSGHLVLARELLGLNTDSGLAFDAVLQLGSILAVYLYFRQDVERLFLAGWKIATGSRTAVPSEERRLLYGILLGTLPALVLGWLLENAMETVFRSALLVSLALAAGSALFLAAEKFAAQRAKTPNLVQAWWIGFFQCLALVPGMSRSGSTISGGLFLGLTREAATRFSFLLSLPIITGTGLLKFVDIMRHGAPDFGYPELALGFAAAFTVGYACIAWLVGYLKRHSLSIFIWYRLALSAAVLLYLAAH